MFKVCMYNGETVTELSRCTFLRDAISYADFKAYSDYEGNDFFVADENNQGVYTVDKEVVKIGSAELYRSNAEYHLSNGDYLLTQNAIYQLYINKNDRPAGKIIFKSKDIMQRGRFCWHTKQEVESLIAFIEKGRAVLL